MHLNRAPGSLERNGAAVGPGGEDVTEEIRLETGLWRWIQFCNSRSRQGIEAAYQTEGLFGHLHIEVMEVNVWMGKQWVLKLKGLFQRMLEEVLMLC